MDWFGIAYTHAHPLLSVTSPSPPPLPPFPPPAAELLPPPTPDAILTYTAAEIAHVTLEVCNARVLAAIDVYSEHGTKGLVKSINISGKKAVEEVIVPGAARHNFNFGVAIRIADEHAHKVVREASATGTPVRKEEIADFLNKWIRAAVITEFASVLHHGNLVDAEIAAHRVSRSIRDTARTAARDAARDAAGPKQAQ